MQGGAKNALKSQQAEFLKYGDIIMLIYDPTNQKKEISNNLPIYESTLDKNMKMCALSGTG